MRRHVFAFALLGLAATGVVGACSAVIGIDSLSDENLVGSGGSSSASTSSGGGSGGAPPSGCESRDDCPPPAPCTAVDCVSGRCQTTPIDADTPLVHQVTGDCKVLVCDGVGGVETKPDTGDPFIDGNPCTDDYCLGDRPKNHPNLMSTCTVGGTHCDAQGECVECLVAGHCPTGVCSHHQCVPGSCIDMVQNNGETAIDCGGPCPGCAAGDPCDTGADCASGVCQGTTCQLPNCSDHVKNGTETGVDCGAICPACPAGQGCASPGDCISGVCQGGVCQSPSCTDGVMNGSETDQDCGGGCPGCPEGKKCNKGSDCLYLGCFAGACTHCVNDKQDFGETDVDCGGTCARGCPLGFKCVNDADCVDSLKCCSQKCGMPDCTGSG